MKWSDFYPRKFRFSAQRERKSKRERQRKKDSKEENEKTYWNRNEFYVDETDSKYDIRNGTMLRIDNFFAVRSVAVFGFAVRIRKAKEGCVEVWVAQTKNKIMLSNIIIYGVAAFSFANKAIIMQSTHMIYDFLNLPFAFMPLPSKPFYRSVPCKHTETFCLLNSWNRFLVLSNKRLPCSVNFVVQHTQIFIESSIEWVQWMGNKFFSATNFSFFIFNSFTECKKKIKLYESNANAFSWHERGVNNKCTRVCIRKLIKL